MLNCTCQRTRSRTRGGGLFLPSLVLDFAGQKTLDSRITFTRATTGAYYDGTTVKAEENLLLRSQEFTSSPWVSSGNNVTMTADTTAAPDGTTTADTMTSDAGANFHSIVYPAQTSTSNAQYTASVFLKKSATTEFFIVTISASTATNQWAAAVVNLTAGTVTQSSYGAAASNAVAPTITSVGNSWYRVTVTSSWAEATINVRIAFSDTGTPTLVNYGRYSFTALGTEAVFLWGAQLEQRSAATAYTPTTTATVTNYIPRLVTASADVARFDHNPTTGESLGLLVEEQRANLLLRSEEFDNTGTWTRTRLSAVTANATVAPDGAVTADRIVEDTATGTHRIFQGVAKAASALTYTASCYLKAGERTFAHIRAAETGETAGGGAVINLSTGQALGTYGLTSSFTSMSATSTPAGNGWYRLAFTFTTLTDTQLFVFVTTATSGTLATPGYTGDGYSGIYVWGAQLEAGAFATSYIPTTTAQVTRSADAATMTGTNFSSWYRADEGTFLYSGDRILGASSRQISISDGSSNNSMSMYSSGADALQYCTGTVSGVAQWDISRSPVSSGVTFKQSFAYKADNVGFVLNAGSVATDSAATVPVVDRLLFGLSPSSASAQQRQHIARLAYYPFRLTNQQLQALTT